MTEPLEKFECFNDYPNVKPSDNPEDYVCVNIESYVKSGSILMVKDGSAHIVEIEKNKDRVMYIVNGDTFIEGDKA